ncbi:beta-1,3-glucan-binding protein-like [Bacillus rossius redtenbacheri]|uniref:beta-1,3-glucan-binding protein-like n=1 Tax=Bacillus rossius redtenbacheri TaxID=93214 RepID=UPI002FDD863D
MLLPSSLLLLLLASLLLRAARCATPPYVVPEPLLQAFSPAGLQVSIPDSEGLQLFAFHGSVNKPMKGLEAGDMSRDVLVPSRGRWVFEEPQVQLLPGDVLYYWLYVQRYGLGYRKDSSYWIVDGDLLYYWLYVQRYGLGYRKDSSYWIVDGRYRCCPGTCSTTGSTSRDTRYGLGYRKDASYWIVDGRYRCCPGTCSTTGSTSRDTAWATGRTPATG